MKDMKDFIQELEKRHIPEYIKKSMTRAAFIFGHPLDDDRSIKAVKDYIMYSMRRDDELLDVFIDFSFDFALTAVAKELNIRPDESKTSDPKDPKTALLEELKELFDEIFK